MTHSPTDRADQSVSLSFMPAHSQQWKLQRTNP